MSRLHPRRFKPQKLKPASPFTFRHREFNFVRVTGVIVTVTVATGAIVTVAAMFIAGFATVVTATPGGETGAAIVAVTGIAIVIRSLAI